MSNSCERDEWTGIETARSLLVVVSAPSGAGKTTLCHRLMARRRDLRYSISCTTRKARKGEVDGVDYHFMDEETFRQRIEQHAFLEYAQVHGHWYGTLRKQVESQMSDGFHCIMDIDVQGAEHIRTALEALPPDHVLCRGYVDVFIMPPSMQALKERLEKRAKDDADIIAQRIQNAADEISRRHEYQYVIINNQLDAAVDALDAIMTAEEHRTIT